MDRPALGVVCDRFTEVDRLAQQVEDPPQGRAAHGHRDRGSGVDHLAATREPVGRIERDRAHAVIAQVLLHLAREVVLLLGRDIDVLLGAGGLGALDLDRVIDLGQLVGEHGLDDDPLDLLDPPYVLGAALASGWGFFGDSHVSPV